MKLPSPTEHLQRAISSPFDDFASSLPPEPRVAGHTFLVLDRPDSQSPSPFFYAPTTSVPVVPKPETAFLYSEGPSERVQFRRDIADSSEENTTAKSERLMRDEEGANKEEEEVGMMVYVLIGLFLLLDVFLFAFRMSWMTNQVQAAKAGYEDRIPTDPVSQKLLAIQTGYRLTCMQDMYQSRSFSAENKDNVVPEERGSESEFNVYFCQSYPKSKDDILREIMAQKMNSTEQNLGQDRLPQTTKPKSARAAKESRLAQDVSACCHWLHRMFISHLVWRFAVTMVTVLLLCLVVYSADFWLTRDSLRVLVGGQSVLRDLHLQVSTA